jgi:hypothetical protein
MDSSLLIELGIRFLVGGVVVSIFSVIGDVITPKSFAGIFSAAPSVALATVGLTLFVHGGSYAGVEGRSMVIGGAALFVSGLVVGWLILRRHVDALIAAGASWVVWAAVALGAWAVVLR